MEYLTSITPWQIVNNTVLAIAIAGVIWQVFSLRQAVIQDKIVIPFEIPMLFIFVGAIVGVELLQVSPLHLIWLLPVSFLLGLAAILIPFIQDLSLDFLELLAMTSLSKETAIPAPSAKRAQAEPRFKSSSTQPKPGKGFGN